MAIQFSRVSDITIYEIMIFVKKEHLIKNVIVTTFATNIYHIEFVEIISVCEGLSLSLSLSLSVRMREIGGGGIYIEHFFHKQSFFIELKKYSMINDSNEELWWHYKDHRYLSLNSMPLH